MNYGLIGVYGIRRCFYNWLLIFCITARWVSWISSKAKEKWKIHNYGHISKCSWHSKLPLVTKVFIWRVLIGGLPLGLALKWRGLAMSICFFALFKWKIVFIVSCNIWFLSKFGVTLLKFGKICQNVILSQDNVCLHNSHKWTQN